MNTDINILDELKKQTEALENANKYNAECFVIAKAIQKANRSAWNITRVMLLILIVAVSAIVVRVIDGKSSSAYDRHHESATEVDMYEVRNLVEMLKIDSAIQVASSVVERFPEHEEAHWWIGYSYLLKGDLRKALQSAFIADSLYSSERSRNLVTALEKRLRDRPFQMHSEQDSIQSGTM